MLSGRDADFSLRKVVDGLICVILNISNYNRLKCIHDMSKLFCLVLTAYIVAPGITEQRL